MVILWDVHGFLWTFMRILEEFYRLFIGFYGLARICMGTLWLFYGMFMGFYGQNHGHVMGFYPLGKLT
jgi:hypothetical protein